MRIGRYRALAEIVSQARNVPSGSSSWFGSRALLKRDPTASLSRRRHFLPRDDHLPLQPVAVGDLDSFLGFLRPPGRRLRRPLLLLYDHQAAIMGAHYPQ